MYINHLIGDQLDSQSFEYYCVSAFITTRFRKKSLTKVEKSTALWLQTWLFDIVTILQT